MFERIAVMGAGSLGTVLGAYLSRAGLDVTFVDPYEDHVKALNEKGAHVTGLSEFTAPAKAVTPENMEGVFDLFIYMAKQTANDAAIPQMLAHCGDDTIICCCQNGIPEMELARYFPADRICGAPVGWGATFKAPGLSEITLPESLRFFTLGSYDGVQHSWLQDVKSVLENMCEVRIDAKLMNIRWTKLVSNTAFSGMSAVCGGDFGAVLDDSIGIQCLAMIFYETRKVAAAHGAELNYPGSEFDTEDGRIAFQAFLQDTMVPARKTVASMLQDLQKGRKCEIRQIDGIVSDLGRQYGIKTPFIDKVVEIVEDIESGKRIPCSANFKDFEPLIANIEL